jgi:phage terminase large subunit-like protein
MISTNTTELDRFKAFAANLILDNGEPLILEGFQDEFLEDVLSGKFSEVWVTLPEASGKSTLLAAVALYWLVTKRGAKILLAAAAVAQAEEGMFRQLSDMVARSEGLGQLVRCIDGRLRAYGPNRSTLIVRAADSATSDGVIPDYCLIDELQAMRDLSLVRTWSGKLAKRGGAMVMISTAGTPTSEYEKALTHMRSHALESTYEGRHLRATGEHWVLHEWRSEITDDPADMEALKLVNVASWLTPAELERKRTAPHQDARHFDRHTRNVASRPKESLISEAIWAAAEVIIPVADGMTFPLQGQESVLGIDYAQSRDAFAAAPLIVASKPWVLVAPVVLVPEVQGKPIERREMQEMIEMLHELYPFTRVALDPGSIGSWLSEWIQQRFSVDVALAWKNTADAQLASGTFLDALYNGEIKHTGSDLLRDHVLNAVGRYDANDRFLFARPADSRNAVDQSGRRIDALVAASLAVLLASTPPPPPRDDPFVLFL